MPLPVGSEEYGFSSRREYERLVKKKFKSTRGKHLKIKA